VQTLSQRTDATEQKQQAADKQLAKTRLTDGFEFNAYARSGMLVNSHGKARAAAGISPASSLNGDAHVGRLGNEKDNYVELSFGKKMTFSDGSGALNHAGRRRDQPGSVGAG
jgi:sucrose porin